MINLEHVHIGFSLDQVLFKTENPSLQKGNCYALLGKNGSGKSTLLKTLCKLILPLNGEIKVNNQPLKNFSIHQIASQIAFLPSHVIMPFQHTVESFVSLGLGEKNRFFLSLTPNQKTELDHVLEKMNLIELKNKRLDSLSDGQKQRVLLAQILARKCSYILLDEPLAHLDHDTKIEVLEYFINITKKENTCILFSTHDQYYLNDSFQKWTIQNNKLIV